MKSDNKIVAIHQPDFFPWLGFFNKYNKSHSFIIADTVQFPKSHGNYTNRVALILNKKVTWLTLPVDRKYKGVLRINNIKILNDSNWIRKTLKTLQNNYGKAPYFQEVYPILKPLIEYRTSRLVDFNMNAISVLLNKFDLGCDKIIYQSNLRLDHLWKTNLNDYIIEMVKKIGGNTYLSGDGSSGYQNDQIFANKNLQIIYTKYRHPSYYQFNLANFESGLSVIDILMNCGFDRVKKLLHESKKK